MTTSQNTADSKKMTGFSLFAGIILLSLRIAYVCYGVIIPRPQDIRGNIGERFYRIGTNLFFIADDMKSKAFMLLLMIPVLLAVRPSDRPVKYIWPLTTGLVGISLFLSTYYLIPLDSDKAAAWSYLVITGLGYLLVETSAVKLVRYRRYVFHRRKFSRDTSGFKQEERLIVTEYSLNFKTSYAFNGKKRKGYVNIVNPRRGVLVIGTPGSGKTWSIIEPAIEQLIAQKRALFVYDFKFPSLTNFAYSTWLNYAKQYPPSTRFYCINFSDLSRTNRCNLIDPATLRYNSDAFGISRTIFLSMNKSWAAKQGDFFQESPIAFLAALIWFLKGYKGGVYCTLPHVIELSKIPYEPLFTILYAEPSTRGMVVAFVQAYLNKTMEMVDGQISSARIPLTRLDSPDIYYVLTGKESCLDINDPTAPAILCLGGDPARLEALAPVLSLYIDRLNRRINQPDRYPAALVLDEFGTVRATSVLTTIATGRSNNIIPILSLQDLSQLRVQYSRDEAEQVVSTIGNFICGQVTGETADLISKRFHSSVHLKTTISINSSDISTSKTEQQIDEISPAALAQLSGGIFAGIVADDPGTELDLKAFRAKVVRKHAPPSPTPLPKIADVTDAVLTENYARISDEIADLVKEEIKRITSDPVLKQFIVKR